MAISAKDKGDLTRRVKLVGVPQVLSLPFLRLVLKWIDCSGIEWTVDRLKQFKVDLLRKKAGLPHTARWLATSRRKNQIFSGELGRLEKYAETSSYRFERVMALVNVYTAFVAPQVTEKQAKKFLDGVTAKAVTLSPTLKQVIREGFQLSGISPRKRKLPAAKPLLTYLPSGTKRAPVPGGTVPEVEGVVDSLRFLGLSQSSIAFLHKYFDLFLPVMEGLEPELDILQGAYTGYGIRSIPRPRYDNPVVVGQIGLIQEPGYKLRAVANPGRVFQRVLEPLGSFLFGLLKTLPWDCTFEQRKADSAVQAALNAQKCVHSVDLSGATDYFPLELQRELLVELLPEATSSVDLFCDISRGLWKLPKGFPKSSRERYHLEHFVQWTKGQPLGLYPSFASFALTHGILLLGLLGRPWDGDFFILGDDVVILDDTLYTKYRETLSEMGCPVSEPKTLNSELIAEFRSVLFLKDRMIPQYKWRSVSDDSFLDIVRNIPSLLPTLRPKQRAVVSIIGPLPEECGGLGWNPQGLSLESRLQPFLPLLIGDYVPRDRIMSYTSYIRANLYASRLSAGASVGGLSPRGDLPLALDQRACSLVSQFLGESLIGMTPILGRNLDLVLDGDVDLPIPGMTTKRVTTLQRWESTLLDLGLLDSER